VPAALAISAFAPWLVTPLLMIGGAFLCYEGVEKLAHKLLHRADERDAEHAALTRALADPPSTWCSSSATRSRAPSAPTSSSRPRSSPSRWARWPGSRFATQVAVLAGIALAMTVGVYGLVAGIVKLDDAGLWLSRRAGCGCAGSGPRHPARCALADEVPVGGRHGGHVPGGRRHPRARRAGRCTTPSSRPWAAWAASRAWPARCSTPPVGVVAGAVVLAVVRGVGRLRRPAVSAV
jgi:uncharacterized protein